jgi:hypothetical protein
MAMAVVVSLFASLLVLAAPSLESKADYTSFDTTAITYNDRVCNLGDPADHLTAETAFEISTSEQLWEITDCVSNSATIYFELGDDIDVSDITRAGNAPTSSPIGYSASGDLSFSGVIDGKNKLISGIAMNSANYGVGLFAYLHDATVSNLAISGSLTTSKNSNGKGHSAGSLAIRSAGQLYLSSISNQASVTGFYYIGGLVGEVSGSANIVASFNSASISGMFYSGGLIGLARSNIYVSLSSNTGALTGRSQLGGLIGIASATATIHSSYNTGAVASSTNQNVIGGLVGNAKIANIDSSYNTGTVSGRNFVGGLVGLVGQDSRITSSYNTGTASGDNSIGGLLGRVVGTAYINSSYQAGEVNWITGFDGLVGTVSGVVTTTYVYSSVASRYVATTPVDDMKLASTYVGFDFSSANPVWGFGNCSDNGGYPMLGVFGALGSYFNESCGVNTVVSSDPVQTPAQTPAPAPAYRGPVIDSALTVQAESEVTFTGRRLDSVTSAFAGGVQLPVVLAESKSLVLEVASSLPPGTYDLVIQSSFGSLTFMQGITVLASSTEESAIEPALDRKLSVGSFKGFIAIYTKGYDGQRLSAKVAGKWLVVESLDESFQGKNYSRTLRGTGSGQSIKVHLYIDSEFLRTDELTTK